MADRIGAALGMPKLPILYHAPALIGQPHKPLVNRSIEADIALFEPVAVRQLATPAAIHVVLGLEPQRYRRIVTFARAALRQRDAQHQTWADQYSAGCQEALFHALSPFNLAISAL